MDLSLPSSSTFQVVPRGDAESLRRGETTSMEERDELDIFLAENAVRDASALGTGESRSPVEIDSALVRLPASTNSGESLVPR